MTGSLTVEVVDCVLNKIWHRAESSLDDLQGHCAWICGELDDLIKAHGKESDKSSQKRIKKEIDLRWKDLESLRVAISHHESNLEQGQLEDIGPEADDAPSGSAATQSSDPPPAEGQAHAMEVDDEDGCPSPASPISLVDNDLLTGGGAVGVEGDLANLTVSSPKGPDGSGEDTSI